MIDEDGDAAVRVEAEEPVLLLFVGHDVAEERGKVSQLEWKGYLGEYMKGRIGRT